MKKNSSKKSNKVTKKIKTLEPIKLKANLSRKANSTQKKNTIAKRLAAKKVVVKSTKEHLLKVTQAASMVKKVVQSNIDATLLKLSPNMQRTLDALVTKIEQTPAHIQDFQALACRVLKHATEINENLKQKIATTSAKIKS